MKIASSIETSKKHKLYEESVQNPLGDIDFINTQFKKLFNRKPFRIREDFGGTGLLACEWVKQSDNHHAWAIDLDNEPIRYGLENHYARLLENEKERMHYLEANVLDNHPIDPDVVVAFNFSYFIFKKRKDLLEYFKAVRSSMKNDSAFFMDIFGGSECYEVQVEETEYDDFSYFWDLDKFNPITNECLYHIHFEDHESKIRYEKVFSYDWRMWTIQEIKEVLEEAGFTKVMTFWDDAEDDDDDSEYYETNEAENCESWVSYIVACP